ncbi:MAG: lipopolysaccharide heptosyltransferase II [Candidatus Omnitrophota bacterium]|nr:MAG: lipopolysaccharide heptosyltransferase II [Candidatus Omnitrophota bacterium]
MNVLQVVPEMNVGGVETGTLDLARHLVLRGHKAVVVSNGGELVKELLACGVIHYQLPVHKKSILNILRMIPKLSRIIEREEIDIVHARSRVPAWIGYFSARRSKRVFITTCHGYYKRHFASRVMGWGKKVIAISNVVARHMIDNFSVPYERIALIPRSVDLGKFKFVRKKRQHHEPFNVGIIGRIVPLKGHLYFIQAMAKVLRIIPELKVWIIGDAPPSKEAYKEQVRVLVRRLGLTHCTEFLGNQRDIPFIIKNLDLLVLATVTQEAFGRVIIEAQASGVPVVATSVGGVVDIIEDAKNGLLVPPADSQAIADACLRIFRNPELTRSLAENAYKKVKEQYTTELMVEKTLKVYNDAAAHTRVLVIKLSSAGDVILSTAAFRAIKEKFGSRYHITLLVGEDAKEVVARCPYIDELVVCDFKGKDKGVRSFFALGSRLRRKYFDVVIDLQNSRRSHLLAWLSWAVERFGYDNGKLSFFLNRRIKLPRDAIDPVTHQFKLLEPLGIEPKDPRLELWPSQEDRQYISGFLSSHWMNANQKIVGINVSASRRWTSKVWPLSAMAKLCDYLGRQDIRVVITGKEEDGAYAQQLIEKAKGSKPINACGKTTLNQLYCLIQQCHVFISGDSAPLHIAAAAGTPFVALFGPTDPRRHLPPAKRFMAIQKDLPCVPCYKSECAHKKCMEAISAEEVFEAVNTLLR